MCSFGGIEGYVSPGIRRICVTSILLVRGVHSDHEVDFGKMCRVDWKSTFVSVLYFT